MHTAPTARLLHVFTIVFGLFLLLASAAAQERGSHGGGRVAPRGVPGSVTSFGFGGHPGFHGVPASVTSTGFGGHAGFRGVPPSVTSLGFGAQNNFRGTRGKAGFGDGRQGFDDRGRRGSHDRTFEHRHRHFYPGLYSPYYGAYYGYDPYAYPYPYDVSADDYQDDSGSYPDPNAADNSNYDSRAADNRQVLEEDYRAGLNRQSEQASQQEQNLQSRPEQPVAAQPSTVLVFKDGHQQEVSNYAIIGATLYELSDGRSKKVQLTDLDLTATVKENDQRGVAFQLPTRTSFN